MTNTDSTRELIYLAGLLHDIDTFAPGFTARWPQHKFFQSLSSRQVALIEKANQWATHIDQQNPKTERPEKPLANLFGQIQIKGKTAGNQYFGFNRLSLAETVVLQRSAGDLPSLQVGFLADFEKLPTSSVRAFSESLYHLLRQYTWCIPASTDPAFEGISLFHHLKLTGALTQCLFDHGQAEENHPLPLQLLCIDLSGIQSFIYNIGSRQAARSLKGRSFSLQLLLDGIARKLIADTQTTPSHVVYSSGGKFFMLLPHTTQTNESLAQAETAIQQAVWDTYQGNLFVCFGRVPFDYTPDTGQVTTAAGTGTLSKLWQEVTREASEQKAQKNKAMLLDTNQFASLFGPTGDGGDEAQCAVTGWEGRLTLLRDETKVHATVKQQIEIGSGLTDTHYITFGDGPFNLLDGGVLAPFALDDRNGLPTDAEYCQLMQPTTTNSFVGSTSQKTVVRSFRFYGGSKQALFDRGKPKTFEELAGTVRADHENDESAILPDQCEGKFRRLAVLRMDVDSLGELFTKGFQDSQATFSAYATLSGLLDWFFSGYLNTIRERAEFRDWVNIIYSGGDDVFAVGRWDRIIRFAEAVQADFKQFTSRPDLTISAGIVLMRPRYPIGKAADQAGEAEDHAKDHTYGGQGKNAVSLFGIAVNWDDKNEWPLVKAYHQKFVDWLRAGTLSAGILQKLFAYYDIYAKGEAGKKAAEKRRRAGRPTDYKPDLSWKWNAAYTLSRHRTDKNKDAIDELKLLLFTRINDGNVRFEALALAMRWAELTIRDYPKTKQNDNGTADEEVE